MSTKDTIRTWINDMGNILLPDFCPICGNPLMISDKCICMECYLKLHFIPQPKDEEEGLNSDLTRRFWGVLPIERATSLIRYQHDSISHQLIVNLKYNHRPDIGVAMGEIIAGNIKNSGFFSDIDIIIPVPLHWTRIWHRGYNQSERLAHGISNVTKIPVDKHVVFRSRATNTQTHLDKESREENVNNLFIVKRPERICNKHILLVDDVMTTGATITSLGKSIVKADSTVRISILTLALAQ